MESTGPLKAREPERVCPHCGALCPQDAPWCWMCRAAASTQAPGPASAPRSLGPWQYSLQSLLLVITLVAVFLGLIVMEPGLAIIAAIFVAPAVVHVLVARHRERTRGKPATMGDKAVTFALSTAAALVSLALGGAAFGAAIFASCIVEARVLAPRMPAGSQNLVAFSLLGISILVAVMTAGFVYWLLRPRRAN